MKLEKVTTGLHPLQSETFNRRNASAANGALKTKIQHEPVELHDQEVIHTEEIETVVSKLNEIIEPLRTNLKFEYHEKLDDYYVTVVNPLTDEVIKEIPSKKMLDMYAAMAEFMGLLVDEKI